MAFMMGTQVMNAQADKPKEKREHKRPTMEQISEMQCNRIANELGLKSKELEIVSFEKFEVENNNGKG